MITNEAVNGKNGVLSNGEMLVYTVESEISEIRAGGFSNVPVLSAIPDFGKEYSHSNVRCNGTKYLHDIFSFRYTRTENSEKISEIFKSARICDRVFPYGAFIRDIETVRPFEIKISLGPWVRRSFIRGYRIGWKYFDVLHLTLPSGTSFYKCETTLRTVNAIVIVNGDASFSESGDCVNVLRGSSRVIVVAGEGERRVKSAVAALKEDISFDESILKNEDSLSEKLLHHLLTHQSENGGVIASRNEPIVRMDSVQTIVGAFLKHARYKEARKTLEFFCKRFEADGRFYQIYSTENGQSERYFSDVSLGCAKLMSAMLDYARESGDSTLIKENIKMMRSAMYAQFDECTDLTMAFSGAETELADSLVNIKSREYASLEATLSFACATLDFCDYCEQNSIKLPHDNGSASRRARAILDEIPNNFIINGEPSLSSADGKIKLPRFAYGDCDGCSRKFSHIYYGELELGSDAFYTCPRCLRDRSDIVPRTDSKDGFSVLAAAILLSNERFIKMYGEDKSRELLKRAIELRREKSDMTSVRADALLLCVARRFGLDAEFLEREIILEAESGKLVNERFDSKTIASILLVI